MFGYFRQVEEYGWHDDSDLRRRVERLERQAAGLPEPEPSPPGKSVDETLRDVYLKHLKAAFPGPASIYGTLPAEVRP